MEVLIDNGHGVETSSKPHHLPNKASCPGNLPGIHPKLYDTIQP